MRKITAHFISVIPGVQRQLVCVIQFSNFAICWLFEVWGSVCVVTQINRQLWLNPNGGVYRYMNVYVPSQGKDFNASKLPVFMWLYGGKSTTNSSITCIHMGAQMHCCKVTCPGVVHDIHCYVCCVLIVCQTHDIVLCPTNHGRKFRAVFFCKTQYMDAEEPVVALCAHPRGVRLWR